MLQTIINEQNGGCVSCHTENPVLPFYAKFPVAGSIIRQDITDGWKQFDVTAVTKAFEKRRGCAGS